MRVSKKTKIGVLVALSIALLMGAKGCNSAPAATAVNKYAESLSHFQDAEIKWHNLGKVDDQTHASIQRAEIAASRAGRNLDQAILVASRGGSTSEYIDVANSAMDELVAVAKSNDPQVSQEMTTALNLAFSLLKNAVSLIQQIKPQSSNYHGNPWGMAFLAMMPLAVVVGGTLTGALTLLNAVAQLEPIAFDLVLKLAQSLKGKSAEEIVALNESLFDKVERTAQEELAKIPDAGGIRKG